MKRDIDFLKVYKYNLKTKHKTITLNGKADKAAIISILIMIVLSGGLFSYSKYIENILEEKQLTINTSAYATAYVYIQEMQTVYEDVKSFNQMIEKGKSNIESVPQLTNVEYQTIKNNLIQGMQLLSMSYSQGKYILTVSAPLARNIPQYVSSIKNTGIFNNVSYNGYNQQSINISSLTDFTGIMPNSNHYVFTISCTLKSGVYNETN